MISKTIKKKFHVQLINTDNDNHLLNSIGSKISLKEINNIKKVKVDIYINPKDGTSFKLFSDSVLYDPSCYDESLKMTYKLNSLYNDILQYPDSFRSKMGFKPSRVEIKSIANYVITTINEFTKFYHS